jgi:hypothetical protein
MERLSYRISTGTHKHISFILLLLLVLSYYIQMAQESHQYWGCFSTGQRNLHGLSPRASYTDRATAACWRSDCLRFADRGCHVVSVTDPYSRILGFLDRSLYFFFQVAPQLYSTRLSGPRSGPTIFFLVVPGIESGPPDL